MLLGIILTVAISIGLVVLIVGGAFWLMSESDHHPWLAKFLASEARMVPGYVPPKAEDFPPGYLDQIPGWDDLDDHNSK